MFVVCLFALLLTLVSSTKKSDTTLLKFIEWQMKMSKCTQNNKHGNCVCKPIDIRNVPAFTAILSKDFTPPVNKVIIFDSVKTNNGGHYSGKTGIFTVPKPGLYMFSATVRSSAHLHCELMVNDTMFVKIHGYNSNAGTSNAVLQLRTGDRVYVRKDFRSNERMLGRSWSMFSGYLIA